MAFNMNSLPQSRPNHMRALQPALDHIILSTPSLQHSLEEWPGMLALGLHKLCKLQSINVNSNSILAPHLKEATPNTVSAVLCTSASQAKVPCQSALGALLSTDTRCSKSSLRASSSCCWTSRPLMWASTYTCICRPGHR